MGVQDGVMIFVQQVKETDAIQWLAVGLSIAEVLLAKANKIALYPIGIAATFLSVYILFKAGLYAESLLNGYYIVMSFYGWWYWLRKSNEAPVSITYSSKKDWMIVAGITTIGFVFMSLVLNRFTNSTVPFWDAWVSATAWAGMWLLSKRKIENWVLLNVSNFFAIPLLLYKQLPLFAALTSFLFVVAIFGYLDWRKIINKHKLITA